jgi:hypothetical protein
MVQESERNIMGQWPKLTFLQRRQKWPTGIGKGAQLH